MASSSKLAMTGLNEMYFLRSSVFVVRSQGVLGRLLTKTKFLSTGTDYSAPVLLQTKLIELRCYVVYVFHSSSGVYTFYLTQGFQIIL